MWKRENAVLFLSRLFVNDATCRRKIKWKKTWGISSEISEKQTKEKPQALWQCSEKGSMHDSFSSSCFYVRAASNAFHSFEQIYVRPRVVATCSPPLAGIHFDLSSSADKTPANKILSSSLKNAADRKLFSSAHSSALCCRREPWKRHQSPEINRMQSKIFICYQFYKKSINIKAMHIKRFRKRFCDTPLLPFLPIKTFALKASGRDSFTGTKFIAEITTLKLDGTIINYVTVRGGTGTGGGWVCLS